MKLKYIIILGLLGVGLFFCGRAWGRIEENRRMLNTYEGMPESLKNMSKDEVSKMMTSITDFCQNSSVELSLLDLFRAMSAAQLEAAQKKGGNEGFYQCASDLKKSFLSSYHSGSSNYGNWKSAADGLAVKFEKEEVDHNK